MYIDSGHFEKAFEPLTSCLQKRESSLGEKSEIFLLSISNLINQTLFLVFFFFFVFCFFLVLLIFIFLSFFLSFFLSRSPGSTHPDVAAVLNKLARVHFELKDTTTAVELWTRALMIFDKSDKNSSRWKSPADRKLDGL